MPELGGKDAIELDEAIQVIRVVELDQPGRGGHDLAEVMDDRSPPLLIPPQGLTADPEVRRFPRRGDRPSRGEDFDPAGVINERRHGRLGIAPEAVAAGLRGVDAPDGNRLQPLLAGKIELEAGAGERCVGGARNLNMGRLNGRRSF
ncbi:hypothetical protein [Chelatococcus asaccharovorans]|uniref:hypothetical protein n=1 Tax=Chelatococcus asaccharovorans TaxID=28210 RepID=UPI002264BEB9|nr:hypothetical protein [Chelatococcus asaccharovorans]